MFDSSTMSTIDRTCCIPITFSTGESHTMELFVTKLDEEYSVVLGYDWLTQHNPSIDWVEMKIMFCNPETWKTLPEVPRPAPRVIYIRLVSNRTSQSTHHQALTTTFPHTPHQTH